MVDTVNLDPSRKKATSKDEAVLNRVEAALGEVETKRESRATLLQRLSGAKGDVSGFTTAMLMRKDMKVNGNSLENQSVVFFERKFGRFPRSSTLPRRRRFPCPRCQSTPAGSCWSEATCRRMSSNYVLCLSISHVFL